MDAGRLPSLTLPHASTMTAEEVLAELEVTPAGLTTAEAEVRRTRVGPNSVRTHHVRPWAILGRQLRSALLILLAVTAVASFFLGNPADAIIIGTILVASVGLGFFNEWRAERAAAALHTGISHTCPAERDGVAVSLDVTQLVPGDVVQLVLGSIVPADIRLLSVSGLACDEGVMTGESVPVDKDVAPVPAGTASADLTCCALMGTVVHAGSGTGVVVATGGRTEFGRLALGLGERQPETDFQLGLRRFSVLLLRVAMTLTSLILVANILLERPVLESLAFALAIAVGITPQLLPAVVSTSLAAGSRRLAKQKVLVKRMVCIEDLGDMDLLITDKTGTLTQGQPGFLDAITPQGVPDPALVTWGLLATERGLGSGQSVGANSLDSALWDARPADWPATQPATWLAGLPFDHVRRMTSCLVRTPGGERLLVTKGAPEAVMAACSQVPPGARETLDRLARQGSRIVAVASRPVGGTVRSTLDTADETDLNLIGFLVFRDSLKLDAAASLDRLRALGVTVKVATGDHPLVAERVCTELGLGSGGTLSGADIDGLDDAALAAAAERCTIFARVTPEHKARIVRLLRRQGRAVGFLGDGVNDALALHAADVGISVDSGSDVAKDAADVVLLEKDLGVLADGIAEGRRVFANTIKYVLMGTSSNFGNMFSASAASTVLPFLPMLPGQILLNNLLYDTGQLTIPTDNVDEEQVRSPSHWDLRMIRRFMLVFGSLSSLFDFLTFAVMLGVFQAGPDLFRSGWFVESLATQTLVIMVIRTRRVPFWKSRPSLPLVASALAVVAAGVIIPFSPLAPVLGFTPLPPLFFAALLGMIVIYLLLVEVAKRLFNAQLGKSVGTRRPRQHRDRVNRRASKFSHPGPLPPAARPRCDAGTTASTAGRSGRTGEVR